MAAKKKAAKKAVKKVVKKVAKKAVKKAPAKKKVAKKAVKKKATKKKATKKKAAKKKKASKKGKKKDEPAPAKKSTGPVKERFNKTQIYTEIAESTGVSRKQVSAVFDELESIISRHIRKGAAGDFVLPGLLKINAVKKPARKERKGINPFTGEETVFKAKPASVAVKIRPLKKLKEMATK